MAPRSLKTPLHAARPSPSPPLPSPPRFIIVRPNRSIVRAGINFANIDRPDRRPRPKFLGWIGTNVGTSPSFHPRGLGRHLSPSNRRRLIAKTCVLLASVPPYARALYDPLVIPCARVHAGDDATNLTSDHLRVPSTPSLSIPFRSPISPSNSNRRDARSLVPWLARVPRYIRLLQSGASSRDRNRKCQRYSEFGSIHDHLRSLRRIIFDQGGSG